MFDLHIHTAFSDGQIDYDTQIQTYIDLGFKVIGFADHVFPGSIYFHPKDSNMNPKGMVNNFKTSQLIYRKKVIRFLDKKYPQIHILNGGEIDTTFPNGQLFLPRGITPDFFDYLLVSKHHTIPKPFDFDLLYKKFPKLEKKMWEKNPLWKLSARLYETGLYSCFRRFNPDIFAHPQEGMPKSIGHLRDLKRMKRIVLMCKKHNVAIELNHLIKDRFTPENRIKWFYPILEYGHEYGVKFSIASDFHGFKKEKRLCMNHSQTMLELVEKYDLELLDPFKFVERKEKNP